MGNCYGGEQPRISNNYNNDEYRVWEKAVEDMTLQPMISYYMANGFPFILSKTTLCDADRYFEKMHGQTYDAFCIRRLNALNISVADRIRDKFTALATVFEEFEYIGWYAKHHTEDYTFVSDLDIYPIDQYWSHGSLTPEIEGKIKATLGCAQK
jgi:hypothetical protein